MIQPSKVSLCYELLHAGDGDRLRLIEKIMERVEIDPETGCWNWVGPHSGNGRGGRYGRMSWHGHTVSVRRALWQTVYGYLPTKKQLDHVNCKSRACVNPYAEHAEAVTHLKNQRRRAARTKEIACGA